MHKLLSDTPLSRRSALMALGAGVTGFLAWPGAVRAGQKQVPSFSFVVVSDTHLGREDKADAAQQWTRTAQEIDAATGDFVLHLGDLVDNGREAQYAVYKQIRQTIRKPVWEIPGNHDPQALFARHIRQKVDTTFDHQGVRFLLLNNSRTGSPDGFLSAAQLTWLGDQCAEAARQGLFLILAMHVPAHDNQPPDAGAHVKPGNGQQELYALLTRHRERVLALFHGHFHHGLRGWDDHRPVQEVIFPSALFNVDRRLAAQNVPGFHVQEFRPGFVLATLGTDGLTLRYKPVGAAIAQQKVCALPQLRS